MKRTSVAAILLAGGLGAAQAAPQGSAPATPAPYVVRYLVFQHQDYWDAPLDSAGPVDRGGHRPPQLAGQSPAGGGKTLDALWTRLSRSSRYRPLMQGILVPFSKPRAEAEPKAVSGQWRASIRAPFDALGGLADRPMRLVMGDDWAPPAEGAARWGSDRIRGTLTFSKGRYAHLEVNLDFAEARRWMPWGLDVRHHFLHQSRRLLPNRYYYFDHPRFGVIARIEPMDQ
ncbi:MAG TPA: CsiV family protein [Gammaproteobacteria bacterium]|nr:CsiV family protein [Gammaproteobacteria bacterium]